MLGVRTWKNIFLEDTIQLTTVPLNVCPQTYTYRSLILATITVERKQDYKESLRFNKRRNNVALTLGPSSFSREQMG